MMQCVSWIRNNEGRCLFLSHFRPFLWSASFFEASGAVAKVGSSLKSNHPNKFSLPESVKRRVEHKPRH